MTFANTACGGGRKVLLSFEGYIYKEPENQHTRSLQGSVPTTDMQMKKLVHTQGWNLPGAYTMPNQGTMWARATLRGLEWQLLSPECQARCLKLVIFVFHLIPQHSTRDIWHWDPQEQDSILFSQLVCIQELEWCPLQCQNEALNSLMNIISRYTCVNWSHIAYTAWSS